MAILGSIVGILLLWWIGKQAYLHGRRSTPDTIFVILVKGLIACVLWGFAGYIFAANPDDPKAMSIAVGYAIVFPLFLTPIALVAWLCGRFFPHRKESAPPIGKNARVVRYENGKRVS